MSLPATLQVALKEWNVVSDALSSGRQMILLRKGGIQEAAGGFTMEHPQFLLFPTYLHQNPQMLKPAAAAGIEPGSEEPATINIAFAGEVTDILPIKSRELMDLLDAEHIWAAPLIDMRFNYRAFNPLYLMLVRAYRLAQAVEVANTPAYAGCKSWVPLANAVSCDRATPALDETQYASRREGILRKIDPARI